MSSLSDARRVTGRRRGGGGGFEETARRRTKAKQQEYFVGARLFLGHVTTSWSNELQSLASSPGDPAGSFISRTMQPPRDAPRSRGRCTCDRQLPYPSLRSRCRARGSQRAAVARESVAAVPSLAPRSPAAARTRLENPLP